MKDPTIIKTDDGMYHIPASRIYGTVRQSRMKRFVRGIPEALRVMRTFNGRLCNGWIVTAVRPHRISKNIIEMRYTLEFGNYVKTIASGRVVMSHSFRGMI
mgnify:CR=1 FL=1